MTAPSGFDSPMPENKDFVETQNIYSKLSWTTTTWPTAPQTWWTGETKRDRLQFLPRDTKARVLAGGYTGHINRVGLLSGLGLYWLYIAMCNPKGYGFRAVLYRFWTILLWTEVGYFFQKNFKKIIFFPAGLANIVALLKKPFLVNYSPILELLQILAFWWGNDFFCRGLKYNMEKPRFLVWNREQVSRLDHSTTPKTLMSQVGQLSISKAENSWKKFPTWLQDICGERKWIKLLYRWCVYQIMLVLFSLRGLVVPKQF